MSKAKTLLCLALMSLHVSERAVAQPTSSTQTSSIRQLTLVECIEQAVANHPRLKAVTSRLRASEDFSRFAGSRPNPSVTIQTENWRAWQQPPLDFSHDIDIFVYGTQRLETASKSLRRRELAERQTSVVQSEAELIRRQLRLDVTRNFWDALRLQTFLDVLAENRVDLAQLVRYTGERVREGFAAGSELIRAGLEQQTIQVQEDATALALERSKLDLLKAMGAATFDTSFRLASPDDRRPPVLQKSLEELRAEALQRRPEVLQLRAKVEAERANLRLQQANAQPDWEISAGYKRTGGYNTAIAYVTVPLPFFSKNRGEIKRAEALISSAEQELLAEENYVRAEVEAAHRAAHSLAARLSDMRRDLLEQADKSHNIAVVAYREGAMDLYKVLETQRARNDARLLYFRTSQELQSTLAELMLVVGAETKR